MKKLFLTPMLFASTLVLAKTECTQEPKEKWQNEAKFQEDLKAKGYKINKFKVTEGNCYEIYGWSKEGQKVEIYFNPITGKVVKEEIH